MRVYGKSCAVCGGAVATTEQGADDVRCDRCRGVAVLRAAPYEAERNDRRYVGLADLTNPDAWIEVRVE